jgi:hypothetical protein
VRVSEVACPFCALALPEGLAPVAHGPLRRYVGKNATALAIIALAAGCGSESGSTTEPAKDAATADTSSDTSVEDVKMLDTAPPDTLSASDVGDEGGPFPIYK